MQFKCNDLLLLFVLLTSGNFLKCYLSKTVPRSSFSNEFLSCARNTKYLFSSLQYGCLSKWPFKYANSIILIHILFQNRNIFLLQLHEKINSSYSAQNKSSVVFTQLKLQLKQCRKNCDKQSWHTIDVIIFHFFIRNKTKHYVYFTLDNREKLVIAICKVATVGQRILKIYKRTNWMKEFWVKNVL